MSSATQPLLRSARAGTLEFSAELERLARRGDSDLERVEPAVREVVAAVRKEGDAALRRYIERFEKRNIAQPYSTNYGGAEALASLPAPVREALVAAAERIRRYHERQAAQLTSFEYAEDGVTLGSRVTPLARVGIYAPGGKARYPSSVLMSAIPARVAGVTELVLSSPDPGPEVRAACHLAGVDGLLDAGGAQAIAAMAYGTESVPRVDKIVGPGNLYVTAAKRLVFGEVAIDSIAGPSEILVVADETADPRVVAADLLSQAEHDEAAYPLLVCTSSSFVESVERELASQLASLPRRNVAEASVRNNGFALVVSGRDELAEVANRLAAEHVAVQVSEPEKLADRIRHAGAIFVGATTPEAAGDYLAGPSHVLPTGGAARFSAPLGVYDFVSRTSLIAYQPSALKAQAPHITALARVEGLEAHARAVEVRNQD
jgi:histidinol dehydrogenase